MRNPKLGGKALSMPAGILIGDMAAMTLTLAGCFLTANMISREWLEFEAMGYLIMVVLILASWLGSSVACAKIKRRKAMVCLFSGTGFFATLLATTALFFDGSYRGVGETLLLILCGSALAFLCTMCRKTGTKHRKTKIRHG